MLSKLILSIIPPVAKVMAIIKQPDPAMDDLSLLALKSLIKDGDCLVSRTDWQLTNLFMPGEWKHSAIYLRGFVYEASSKDGVRKVSLEEFFFKKDHVGLCRYTEFTPEMSEIGFEFMEKRLGSLYDWSLIVSNNGKYYCSELCFYFNSLCFSDFTQKFVPSTYLGKEVIRPTDLWKNLVIIGKWG
jgi:hypothetical protein